MATGYLGDGTPYNIPGTVDAPYPGTGQAKQPPPALTFNQWLTSDLGKQHAATLGQNPTYEQLLGGYQNYVQGYSGPKPNEANYLFNPGSKEDIWNRLLFGEAESQKRTGALDKEIRGVYGQMMLDSGKPDQMALTDINRQEKSGRAGAFQDLATRGLGNTTVVNAQQNRVSEGAQRARTGVYDTANRQKLAVQGAYANYLNSISNNGPDSSIYANLLTGTASQGKKTDYLATLGPAALGAAGLVGAALV